MPVRVYFAFSTGLKTPITVPKGTLAALLEHVEEVERVLKLKRTKFQDNPTRWGSPRLFEGVSDKLLCDTVEAHNERVRLFYDELANWAKKPPEGETEIMTPADAERFWHGLDMLEVPPERWTREYYIARMESIYEVLRGRESEGMTMSAKALTPKQAAEVIWAFERFLDPADTRLQVPRGRDYLASSDDGGYDWCEYDWCDKCGEAIHPDDIGDCRRRKCPLKAEQ